MFERYADHDEERRVRVARQGAAWRALNIWLEAVRVTRDPRFAISLAPILHASTGFLMWRARIRGLHISIDSLWPHEAILFCHELGLMRAAIDDFPMEASGWVGASDHPKWPFTPDDAECNEADEDYVEAGGPGFIVLRDADGRAAAKELEAAIGESSQE